MHPLQSTLHLDNLNMEMDIVLGEMITQVICDIYLAWGPLGVDCAQTKGHPTKRK